MTKAERKAKKLRKREENTFNLKLSRIYGLDAADLSQEASEIFHAAGSFHRKAFDIVDKAKTPQEHASLSACAEHAIINTFGLKVKAQHSEHVTPVWNAQKNGVVPEHLLST